MILVTKAWYNEVGYSFNISHKVNNLIRDKVIEKIIEPNELDKKDNDWYLNLSVATDSNTKELEVRGPDIRKRAKFIDFGLWLPHDAINKSDYPLKEYIKYYFLALKQVFRNYNIPEEKFDPIQKFVEKEVLNNNEYEYTDEE